MSDFKKLTAYEPCSVEYVSVSGTSYIEQLKAENVRLRELMRDTYDCICEMYDYMDGGYAYEDVEADPAYGPILKRMRELGVEVDE